MCSFVCPKVCQWRFPGRSCYKSVSAVTTLILCHWRERACPFFHLQCPNLCKSTALMLKAISSAINLTVTTSAQPPDNIAPCCGSGYNSPQFVIPTNLSLSSASPGFLLSLNSSWDIQSGLTLKCRNLLPPSLLCTVYETFYLGTNAHAFIYVFK